MPKYVVKPGRQWGVRVRYGPGDVVELTEHEAAGLDHIFVPYQEPVVSAAPLDGSIKDIEKWLETGPSIVQVSASLQAEKDGQNRKGAVDAMAAYILERQGG